MQRNSLVPELLLSAAILSGGLSSVGAQTNTAPPKSVTVAVATRPAKWAVKLDYPNLPNFHIVTTNLYRGAQPNVRGMKELKTMGIKTVVNLRNYHSDDDEARGLGLTLQRLHMKPWHSEEEDVLTFLKIVADTNNYPIFVHCQRGADRTGLVCAMYRITCEGWTKPDAIQEMKDGGYNFDTRWKNIVRYIEQADVEKLKREAGISNAPKP
jgi:protein tyrosine/serine phosphatase